MSQIQADLRHSTVEVTDMSPSVLAGTYPCGSIKGKYDSEEGIVPRIPIELVESGGPRDHPLIGEGAPSAAATAADKALKLSRWKAHAQFMTLCWTLFLAGWNDGTTGPLLPRIQEVYHVGFAIVSLIFVFSSLGSVAAAMANIYLTDKVGFGKVVFIGSLAQVAAYAIQSPALPFPVLVLGYAINGFGIALQVACANGFVASLKDNSATKMGIIHAIYGSGALVAPIISTQFAQLPRWSFHFLVSLGIAISNSILLITVFRFKTQDECRQETGQKHQETASSTTNDNLYHQIFRMPVVHMLAFFILIYVGVEVTLGGWIVTYIIDERGGGPSSGYISSGFFGGLTLGRVALLWVNKKVGERRVIFLYGVIAIALELVIWLVPSLIGGAVTVSMVGMLLGPIFPIVMNHCGRILPPRLLTGCIGWISGFGCVGSAFLPFLTGVIASKAGIKSLQPLLVSLMGCMLVVWFCVPASPRRVD